MSNYYLIIKGKQKGPYTAERMQGMWASKSIAPGTLCQKEGETGSRPIEQFSEFTAKGAPQKAAAATPTTSAAQKTTSTTGVGPLPLKYIIPAVAVLLLVAVIAVFRSIQFAFQFDLASAGSLTKVAKEEPTDREQTARRSLRSVIAKVARAIWAERCVQARANN